MYISFSVLLLWICHLIQKLNDLTVQCADRFAQFPFLLIPFTHHVRYAPELNKWDVFFQTGIMKSGAFHAFHHRHILVFHSLDKFRLFYEGVSCHRLVTDGIFVLQCGDPDGTGGGGPGYNFGPIENAPADDSYVTGSLAMARVGGNGSSMGSQFFIVYQDSRIPSDDAGGYTIFGKITAGLDGLEPVISAGVEGGASDGPPALETRLSTIELR